jgi:hypothetical protein
LQLRITIPDVPPPCHGKTPPYTMCVLVPMLMIDFYFCSFRQSN